MVIRRCVKCGGQVFLEPERGEPPWHCLQCGNRQEITREEMETTNVPPRPVTKNRYELSRYYEEHKGAILHDLDAQGEKAMMKRWNMSQATWNGLKKRWRPEVYGASGHGHRKPAPGPKIQAKEVVKQPRVLTADYFAGYRQAVLDGAPKISK